MYDTAGHDRQSLVTGDDSERMARREAQAYNVSAARAVAAAVSSTLGPDGLNKLLIDSTGERVVTGDGETVLSTMEVTNPTARMLIDVANAQADEVGDGTTSAVVLAGALLENAADLVARGVHPQRVVAGFERARSRSVSRLDELGEPVSETDGASLRVVAETALSGAVDEHRETLAALVVDAVRRTSTERGPNLAYVDVETEPGDGTEASELFEGMVYDREPLHPEMPTEVDDGRFLLVKGELTFEPTVPGDERYTSVRIDRPDDVEALQEFEDRQRRARVGRVVDAGVDCVFCEKGIDDASQRYLAREGILAVRRVDPSHLEFLRRVVGGTVLTHDDGVTDADVGRGSISRDRDGERMHVTGPDAEAVTLLLRGATQTGVAELERGVEDALRAVERAIRDGRLVPGAGATAVELARDLRSVAARERGREQLAIEAVADALEVLPKTIVENAGQSGIDALAELRTAHAEGNAAAGWDVGSGAVVDATDARIVGPVSVTRQAISSAVEAATFVLRIDGILSAGDLETLPEDDS